jgi:hypothetical protein
MDETTNERIGGHHAGTSDRERGRWARLLKFASLALLPLVLALAVYYRAQLAGAPLPRPQGDAALYAYQLKRAAECGGRWWRVGNDARLGHPYPTEFAKHPGLFEGVDLMLLAGVCPAALSAAAAYHGAVLTVLAVNGWIAAWLVWRSTRKAVPAAAAVVLITLNESVAARILGHLHLFKFCWALLAVWAFVRFLEQPSWRRGVLLGLAATLVLQGSFYLGFFVTLGLGAGYGIAVLAGRVPRGHGAAALAAALTFLLSGGILCFPVWTASSEIAGSARYFHRAWFETWTYGSELWKYLVPRTSSLAQAYYRDLRGKTTLPMMDEAWFFPGYSVVFAALIAGLSRLRRKAVPLANEPFVSAALGVMAIWGLLSLAGGPGTLLFFVVPSFRCYGRAGLLVVGVGSVLAPIVLHEFVRTRRRPLIRRGVAMAVMLLVAGDAWLGASAFPGWMKGPEPPAWVQWLGRQPSTVRLAVFTPPERNPVGWWGLRSLEWLPMHGHGTLCGSDFALFEGDLRLLGASYQRINPAGLRFVVSLGYEAIAFHRDYLADNTWITQLPWLERVVDGGDWLICRAGPELSRLPQCTLDQLLNHVPNDLELREAPLKCWITGSWPVSQDTIVPGSEWARLAWCDEQGRLLSKPQPALYQHVFGPGIPAYSVCTPARAGTYSLVVFDRHGRRRGAIPHRIVADLAVSQPALPARRPSLTVHSLALPPGLAPDRAFSLNLRLINASQRYLLSQVFREHLDAVSRTHPGLRAEWDQASAGAMVLRFVPIRVDGKQAGEAWEIPLPRDLPPGGRVTVRVPADRLPPCWADSSLRVEPSFAQVGHLEAPPEAADLKISLDRLATDVARSQVGTGDVSGAPPAAALQRRR